MQGVPPPYSSVLSLPSRERGLKCMVLIAPVPSGTVAPFAGAWIEIPGVLRILNGTCVAPFAGAWIEILRQVFGIWDKRVAPFAGAWIEILNSRS